MEAGIEPTPVEQLLMGSGLSQLPVVEHEDSIHALDGGKAVGDDQ
jgi:hypothetical protein